MEKSDRGAAIVTVLVVVAFITVIATTLLYVTGLNYRMKNVDYQNKISFYSGEIPMEEIKARFAWDLADSCGIAYGKTMGEYVGNSEGNRAEMFRKQVALDLQKKWNDDKDALGGDWASLIQSYVDTAYAAGISITYPDPLPVGYTPILYDEVKGTITFRGISLSYEENGYLTRLSTDVLIVIPELDWSAQSSRTSFSGMNADEIQQALKRETIDTSDCVVYINWSKD